ncbi:protein of unknown function [Pseudomonas sp. JV551A1]|uniref:Uncharacterized protein n=1 Tax=Pseudomonas inefficax TaxID=2078786 RepID=A0AAQ1PBP7_9PSED|nr:protein of unknown function [Pseudomonas sp. JV551A1]SPO62918.1 protein of unknown function [Pseudomonas inefficax]
MEPHSSVLPRCNSCFCMEPFVTVPERQKPFDVGSNLVRPFWQSALARTLQPRREKKGALTRGLLQILSKHFIKRPTVSALAPAIKFTSPATARRLTTGNSPHEGKR